MKKNHFQIIPIMGAILLSFFVLLIPFSHLKRATYHLINANDFAIYQQAIYDIAYGISFNPYLTIRTAPILNDHFDPIIFLAAGFVKLFGYSSASLIFFEWLWFVALLFLIYHLALSRDEKRGVPFYQNKLFLLLSFFVIFSRFLLQGLEFPIHPTTWSMVPLFLLSYFVHKDHFKGVVLTVISLCFFRESYPFAIVAFSFYYLFLCFFDFKKIYFLRFLILFSIGIISAFIISYVRPILLGPIINYGHDTVKQLITSPFLFTWNALINFRYPVKEFLFPMVLFIWMMVGEIKKWRDFILHPGTALLFFSLSLFAIHVLAGRMAHHHSISVLTPLLGLVLLSPFSRRLLQPSHKKVLILMIGMAFFTSSSRYTKMVKNVITLPYPAKICQDKLASFEKLEKLVSEIPSDKTIIASGGIIPAVMSPGKKIYQFCEVTPVLPQFDYLLLERNYAGDTNPLPSSELLKIEQKCRGQSRSILYEDTFFVLMQGPFNDECLGLRQKWPTISPLALQKIF